MGNVMKNIYIYRCGYNRSLVLSIVLTSLHKNGKIIKQVKLPKFYFSKVNH